ncbi:MAG: archaemetzincin family Zn-dependent metalloprotease [Syntrophomonadaceae bacterium]
MRGLLFLGFVASLGHTPAAQKKPVVAVVVIGDVPRSTIEPLAPVLRETFDAEIVVAPDLVLPAAAWNASRRQWSSTKILDALASAKRPEWERLLGIVDADLYVPDLNFVFGEADPRRGVAVFSLARLRAGADAALLSRRAATEAVHELGHTYGLSHCEKPTCVMWFSNTLSESDGKGTRFCPEHERELEENRGR